MNFHRVPVLAAEGAILAHATVCAGKSSRSNVIAKGTKLTSDHVTALLAAGVETVQVAQLDAGDIVENEAATYVARKLIEGQPCVHMSTALGGRVNIQADCAGVAALEVDAIHRMNAVDPGITVATVQPWMRMGAGGLMATIKIIPFAVPQRALHDAGAVACGAIGLRPPVLDTATLIETRVRPQAPPDKGRRAMQTRLDRFGVSLTDRLVVPHEERSICEAIETARSDLILILTDTATSDLYDTAPAALRLAGGDVIHYGMPVDPGNLLFLGKIGSRPVIGLPGCARSPALNGADWVMERVICGVDVTAADIMGMGVGGLLKDIPERGKPRR
ncbi:molybdopterin-binding protein [Pseudooctadecabacter jejudonensis]|uniref:Uncharacterized protein n=1 Tax=Pseudooctadecabacter jejudonensis TaxID=1391910 RepID=A0A1Y5RBV5_9RHOB|nr:molybdopterin-binding protein [Pseudooctadecabacter jejudonensis]SLN13802.1 hypothetical protein PSJ8397_00237 [Pseudooctadecabacter jejudonensis]